LSLDDYTDAEIKACWYDEEDNTVITMECLKIIKKLAQGKAINGRKYCVRGLERMAPKANEKRELNKTNAYIAVLQEQNNQLREGRSDPKEIARQYRYAAAKLCQHEAGKAGERDALFVKKMLTTKKEGTTVSAPKTR
jgi:cell division protein FtsB